MALTKLERNKIYEAITESGLNPAEFKLTVDRAKAVIAHNSGSTFEFVKAAGNIREAFSKAVRGEVGTVGDTYYSIKAIVIDGSQNTNDAAPDFPHLMIDIREWADEIKLVLETPDLWTQVQRSRELITQIDQTDSNDTQFTEDEQRQISAQLQEIKNQIREQFELTTEQIEHVDARLDAAEEASKRIGRKDWLLLFGGTILNLIVTDTVTPGVAGHIFTTVVQGIAHLFGAGPPQILA
jgi:hypothetical protein